MTPEGKVKEQVDALLARTPNCWWFKPSMNGFGRSGIPDYVGTIGPHSFVIEAKKYQGKPTPWQARELLRLMDVGCTSVLLATADAAGQLVLRPFTREELTEALSVQAPKKRKPRAL